MSMKRMVHAMNWARIVAACALVAAAGCNRNATKTEAGPSTSATAPAPVLSPGTLDDPGPTYLESSEGLEGNVGIEECDRWVRLASECASSPGHVSFLAQTKRLRMIWMLEARKSRDNVEQQKRLQEQCRVAL